MSRPSIPQRPQSTSSYPVHTSPTLPAQGTNSVRLPMLTNNHELPNRSVTPPRESTRPLSNPEFHSASRLGIENIHLSHQNGSLARELAHSRYTIHALRQIVSQKEAAEQRAQNELKQSLWRVRVLEAVVGRMSEQLVLLMGEQRGGFDEGTDVVGLAREVAVGEFYRQHALLQQRELDAIRGELGTRNEEEYDPEEDDYEDITQQISPVSTDSLQNMSGKASPPPPVITITDSDADQEQPPTFDNDQSPSSSSSEDDELEDYLEEAEEQFGNNATITNMDPIGKKMYDTESSTVLIEERPSLRADVLFARMRVVSGEV